MKLLHTCIFLQCLLHHKGLLALANCAGLCLLDMYVCACTVFEALPVFVLMGSVICVLWLSVYPSVACSRRKKLCIYFESKCSVFCLWCRLCQVEELLIRSTLTVCVCVCVCVCVQQHLMPEHQHRLPGEK